jgi:hypothetical protein
VRRAGPRRLAIGLLAALAAGACGKRGNPLPPLRLVPAPISDLNALRVDDRVTLAWTIPAANTDGSTPAAVSWIEIYAAQTTAAEPAPTPAALINPERLLARLAVRDPAVTTVAPPAGATAKPYPAPGERGTYAERVDTLVAQGAAARHYVAIPVTGSGAGRRGTPSDVVTVPVAPAALPAAPGALAATHSETEVIVTWEPGAPGQTFRVLGSGPVFDALQAPVLTPAPIAAARFTQPVEFGRERCFVVRTLSVTGTVTLEGPPAPPVCVTPVDRFPPAGPANLQAIQEGAAVSLVWTGVTAADLAGYVILRGEGADENMQPLVGAPVQETTYRDEAVRPGVTYVYAVYAQDRAAPPNVSQLSNRQTVTVR